MINTDLMYALMGAQAPQMPPQQMAAPMGQQQRPQGGGLEALMGNPLFGAGMGLLSGARGGNPWQSALAGMYGSQLYKQRSQENELKMQEFKAQKEQMLTVSKLAQEGLKTLDVDGDGNISPAEQARADYLRAAAQSGDQSMLMKASETLASLQPKKNAFQDKLDLLGIDPATLSPEQKVAMIGGGVNVNMGPPAKPIGASAIDWRLPDGTQPNPMMTVEQVAAAGGRPISPEQRRPPTVEEAAKTSAAEDSITMLNRLESLVGSGGVPVGPRADVWRSMRNPQEDAGAGVKIGADTLGRAYPISQPEAEAIALSEKLSTVLLQAVRGAQVGPMEQAKFEKQLPRLGQPESVFSENIKLTRKNLEYLTRRRSELRSGSVAPPAIANPNNTPDENVIEWESLP